MEGIPESGGRHLGRDSPEVATSAARSVETGRARNYRPRVRTRDAAHGPTTAHKTRSARGNGAQPIRGGWKTEEGLSMGRAEVSSRARRADRPSAGSRWP